MKKVLIFIFVFSLWILGSLLFKYDIVYYQMLNLPNYIINPILNNIIWIIIYFLITLSIMKVSKHYKIIGNNDYFFILIINYLANMVFPLMFYNLKSPFLGFIINTIILISSIYLLIETRKINKKAKIMLIPYVIYATYSFIVSFIIWIMNF